MARFSSENDDKAVKGIIRVIKLYADFLLKC